MIDGHTDRSATEVAEPCGWLRSLRLAAGHALLQLWKGRTVDLGVDSEWLESLVERLRQEVQVHEVETVTPPSPLDRRLRHIDTGPARRAR